MGKRFWRQNRLLVGATIGIFILFALVLFLGGNQIYEQEARWRHDNTAAQLLLAKHVVSTVILHSYESLFLLNDLPGIKRYIDSGFESPMYKKETQEILHSFATVHKQYFQIGIITSSGYELIRIQNKEDGTTTVVPDSHLQLSADQYYFQESMKLGKNRVYVSLINLDVEHDKGQALRIPVIRLATPLFDSNNNKRGILVLDLYASKILEALPQHVFIQTNDGKMISIGSNGSIIFKDSPYVFTEDNGRLYLSDTETLHYSTLELLSGQKWIIAIVHSYPLLKNALRSLILISAMLIGLFLVLTFIIGYTNVLTFKDLIGAQKAIISSLVELTEGRDPETAGHLERTRNYAIVLARYLKNNPRYSKIITEEFIEDLYEAALLHDIGKVCIPDSILMKETKLTAQEYEKIKEHVRVGRDVLQSIIDKLKTKPSFLIMARNICAYHHEKYNGKGYPDGLKGQEIPLEARIFALCDAYDAIRSKRAYKGELSHEEAIRRICADRGEHFDPEVVDAFLQCEKEFGEKGFKIRDTYFPGDQI